MTITTAPTGTPGPTSTSTPRRNQIDPEFVLNFNLTHILSSKTFFDVKGAYFNGYYNLEPVSGRDVSVTTSSTTTPISPATRPTALLQRLALRRASPHPLPGQRQPDPLRRGLHPGQPRLQVRRRVRALAGPERCTPTRAPTTCTTTTTGGTGTTATTAPTSTRATTPQTRVTRLEAFAQDSWQVTKRLNLSLGVRASQLYGKVKESRRHLLQSLPHRPPPRLHLRHPRRQDDHPQGPLRRVHRRHVRRDPRPAQPDLVRQDLLLLGPRIYGPG